MALINICLAKSTIMNEKNIAAEYLIHFEGTIDKGYSKPSHKHDCWQMEVVLSGRFEAEISGKKLEITAPSIVMIPPGVLHGFKYREMTKIISIRFNASSIFKDIILFPDAGTVTDFCHIFEFLLGGKTNLNNHKIIMLEGLIMSLFQIHLIKEIGKGKISNKIVERATREIENASSYNIRASELAVKCSCSQGYLLAVFKKEKGVSLKRYISEKRIELMKKYLSYSNMSIGQIAEKTCFPDIYAFSRFFKKMTKLSPSSYRSKMMD